MMQHDALARMGCHMQSPVAPADRAARQLYRGVPRCRTRGSTRTIVGGECGDRRHGRDVIIRHIDHNARREVHVRGHTLDGPQEEPVVAAVPNMGDHTDDTSTHGRITEVPGTPRDADDAADVRNAPPVHRGNPPRVGANQRVSPGRVRRSKHRLCIRDVARGQRPPACHINQCFDEIVSRRVVADDAADACHRAAGHDGVLFGFFERDRDDPDGRADARSDTDGCHRLRDLNRSERVKCPVRQRRRLRVRRRASGEDQGEKASGVWRL